MKIEIDSAHDVLIVEGTTYSGDLFRCFGMRPGHPDALLKIIKREDGTITIAEVRDKELSHRFDLIMKAGA